MQEDSLSIMEKLRVKLLAFPAAELSLYDKAKKRHLALFDQEKVEFVNDKPDILMFLTGGSEKVAISSVQEFTFYLILANRENNSWAAATEVKAWMNQHNISSVLVDCEDPKANEIISEFHIVKNAIHRLHGQRLGMVGTPSDWLVASVINPFILQSRLGIEQVDIPWSDILLEEVNQVAPDFTSLFQSETSGNELFESGKIYEGLASLIPFYRLNALSVECFSLVNSSGHTACLALSKLNLDGIPSGCEGDTCSAVGLMIVSEVCGVIPWMANTVHVKENSAFFAHCTAPTNLLSKFKLDTHYETEKGLAINGDIAGDEVTIFRIDNTLNRIFVSKGNITNRTKVKTACRTQVEVRITESASCYFLEKPFGNHHLIIPGDWLERLRWAALLLRMEIIW